MTHRDPTVDPAADTRERGAAIIIALMVSLVLAFLGLGLLLQTSLGLQAAGTDRWVVRALYAADAGTQAQTLILFAGAIETGAMALADDPNLPGMMAGTFNVTVTDLCQIAPNSPAIDLERGEFYGTEWFSRHFSFRSTAQRDVGSLVGLTQATVRQDVSIQPVAQENLFYVTECY